MERTSSVASEPLHAVGYTTTKSQNIGNGELEIFSNRQMHGPCLVIKEPAEENNESSEDKTANLAAILDHYSRIWLERTKYHLGDLNYTFYFPFFVPISIVSHLSRNCSIIKISLTYHLSVFLSI